MIRKFIKFLFGGLTAVLIILITMLVRPLPNAPMVGVGGNFVIRNIDIVDVIDGGLIEDATVVIGSGRIISIQTDSAMDNSVDFLEIDGSDLYLAPGLWDMHTHSLKLSPQLHHPLFIRYGVTSVRDMSGCLERDDSYWACPQDRISWELSSLAGESISPRYPLQSSFQTNGGNEVPAGFSDFFRLSDAVDAERLLEFYSSQGVHFIKTYSDLSLNQFDELANAARESNLSLAGHIPIAVSLAEALDAGMTSIEHGRLFMFECYEFMDAFRTADDPMSLYTPQKIREIIDHQDQQKCSELMRAMASTNTHWVPTLTTLRMSAMARDVNFRSDSRLNTIPTVVKALIWDPDANRAADYGFDEQGDFVYDDYFQAASRQVAAAKAEGVKILAGTDSTDTYVFTGSGLHDELSLLVEAGLSPLEALQAATIDSATFANLDHELGSVEENKKADLLFLKENPLLNIDNTRHLAGVMFNGRYFDEAALNQLEQFSVDMAQSITMNLNYLADLIMSPLMRVQFAD